MHGASKAKGINISIPEMRKLRLKKPDLFKVTQVTSSRAKIQRRSI